MQTPTFAVSVSVRTLWISRLLSALPTLFLLVDSIAKILKPAPVIEANLQLGYAEGVIVGLGVLELLCIALYIFPRASVLGVILLTGYLGGAIATHVRNGSDLFSLSLPFILGLMLWGGLYLREPRLHALLPLRR